MFIEGEITVGDRGLQRPNLDHQILTTTIAAIELQDQTLMETPAVIELCHQILMAHRHCNTPGVDHQLSSGFKLKHDNLVEMTMPKSNLWK
jgi:hypothetical protein